jgi:hypothetical protein
MQSPFGARLGSFKNIAVFCGVSITFTFAIKGDLVFFTAGTPPAARWQAATKARMDYGPVPVSVTTSISTQSK